MASNRGAIPRRIQKILSASLVKLTENPPTVNGPEHFNMADFAFYKKEIKDIVDGKMLKLGYKMGDLPKWQEEYEEFMAAINQLPWREVSKTAFIQSLHRAQKLIEELKVQTEVAPAESADDDDWEDFDTSTGSNFSSLSRPSRNPEKAGRSQNSRTSLFGDVKVSVKKKVPGLSRAAGPVRTENQGLTPKKAAASGNTSANKSSSAKPAASERESRALKRQASVSQFEAQPKKTRAPSVDRAEFARSQNSRVQQVKERKEQQEKERLEMIEAKMQQKEHSTKERKVSKDNKTASNSSVLGKKKASTVKGAISKTAPSDSVNGTSTVTASATKAAAKPEKAPIKKNSIFAKPTIPILSMKAATPKTKAPLAAKNAQPKTMQSKAKDGLRQGDLTKQAMYQSMLATGDSDVHVVNSTFLPGENCIPNFDASMAINGGPVEATFVVGGQNKGSPNAVNDVTYVSKPGLVASPLADKKCIDLDSSVFIDSFNESYRDYGLEDLCSDSDNTDDENQPNKRVPKWAEMRSKRFASRVLRQKDLGQTIEKYGMNAICMPSIVDLELIFQTTSARFQRLNTSSGIWNDTAEFIND